MEPDILSLFDRALLDAVKTWLDMGDSVVLGIDMNDDVRTSTLTKGLQDLGLSNAVLSLHSPASPPATQNSNQSRKPIDAIFVSCGVVVTRAGYCPFDGDHRMQSDHLMLWVELDNSSIFGQHISTSRKITASRLKANHPGIEINTINE